MAVLVWVTMGLAIWHFTIFLPDRFWAGIVGALLGAVFGALIFGAIIHAISGKPLGDTDLLTCVTAIPGAALGLALIWWIGVRQNPEEPELAL